MLAQRKKALERRRRLKHYTATGPMVDSTCKKALERRRRLKQLMERIPGTFGIVKRLWNVVDD